MKEKLEGLVLSQDSPLDKTVLEMAQQFVHYLEEPSIIEGEVKELKDLMRICNLNTSSLQKKAVRMYNDHVESLIEAGD